MAKEYKIVRQCTAVKKNGEPCKTNAMFGKDVCSFHAGNRSTAPRVNKSPVPVKTGIPMKAAEKRLTRIRRVEKELYPKLLRVNKALIDPTNLLGEIKTARALIANVMEVLPTLNGEEARQATTDVLDQLHKLAQIVKIQVDNTNSTLVTKVQVAQFKGVVTNILQKYVPAGQLRPCLEDLQRGMQDIEDTVNGQEEV